MNSSDDTIVEFNKFKNDSVFGREVNSLIIDQIRNSSIQIEYYRAIENQEVALKTLQYHYSLHVILMS